jgi:hypothetical protein
MGWVSAILVHGDLVRSKDKEKKRAEDDGDHGVF